MKPFLVVVFSLILVGCASTKLTEIEPRTAETTPSPTVTKFILKDSVVTRWVVRDSLRLHDSTVAHATADAMNFYIFSGWFTNEHGDSNYVTVDTQTGEGSCSTHFAPVKVSYQDTTHSVTPPPIEQGYGIWSVVLIIFACAIMFTGIGIVLGKFTTITL